MINKFDEKILVNVNREDDDLVSKVQTLNYTTGWTPPQGSDNSILCTTEYVKNNLAAVAHFSIEDPINPDTDPISTVWVKVTDTYPREVVDIFFWDSLTSKWDVPAPIQWTKIIDGPTTTLAHLSQFGTVSAEMTNTFYSDPAYGIGWGNGSSGSLEFSWYVSNFNINVNFTECFIEFNAPHTNSNEMGWICFLGKDPSLNNYFHLSLSDSWVSDEAKAVWINNVNLTPSGYTFDLQVNKSYTSTLTSTVNNNRIFFARTSGYNYKKMYIKNLWVK